MRKLFRAAFYRTENKKMIRIELVIAVLLSAFIILNGYFQTNLTNAYIYKLVARFFGYSPLMGPFIAVFAAYWWGTDYEYGTLRNKLICGHTREEVYFSNLLLTICAGLSTALIWLIVNGMLGIPLLGTASLNLSLGEMAFYIFSSLLMVVALSSVCCLLASLAENKNSATLLCLGAVAAMVIIGMLLYDRFAEPELLDGWMWSDTDPTVRWHPQNIKFIGGTFRILLEFLICLTPGGQGVILCEEGVEHLIFLPLCSAFVIFSTSLIGSRSFKKKNLKEGGRKMFPWILCCILLIVVFFLITKIIFIEKSIDEIHTEFQERLSSDTNTLIDISSSDPHLRKLASEINIQLRLLRKERHRYQQGDLELKEAITNISHDLRTPLTAINGYLDLLEREEKSETVHCYLSQIQNRTDVLKNLTEELFRYSVVTSFQELKPERMDVVRALEESLLSFYAVMQEKGIQPEIELPEEPVFRELDAGAVNRIFSNIISNALKYSDGDLSVVMDKNGCVTFSNTAHNLNYVTVGRLFDRFYTVEASRNSTGLGLSIAKLLIERMGGSIGAIYNNDKLQIKIIFAK